MANDPTADKYRRFATCLRRCAFQVTDHHALMNSLLDAAARYDWMEECPSVGGKRPIPLVIAPA
jgi:hypothetical protein